MESNRLRATCERWVQVRFLARLFGRLAWPCSDGVEPEPSKLAIRQVIVEWRSDSGEKAFQRALLQSDREGRPRLLVRQRLPVPSARICEKGFEYSVEVLSTVPVDGGFESRLEYLGEGRRREERARTNGQALLEGDGSRPMQVDVVNVSTGGMQLLATQPVVAGTIVRISGTGTAYMGVVRYCNSTAHGYRVGVQLFGENRRW